MKKILVVVLSLVVVVLAADLIYMGVLMFREPELPPPPPPTEAATREPSPEVSYAIPVPQSAKLRPDDEEATPTGGGVTLPTASYLPTGDGATVPTTREGETVRTEYTKQEAITAFGNGIAHLKAAKSFTGVRRRITAITLDACSVPVLRGTVQNILDEYTGDKTQTYRFVNGRATDSETNEVVTPNDVIPPVKAAFSLDAAGVSDYNVSAAGTNTVFTLRIIAETCTLDNPVPYYHAQAMNYLDLTALDGTAKLTKADFTYQTATLILTVNAEGVPLSLREMIPMNGSGEGSMLGFTAGGSISGNLDESWSFTW